MLKIVNSEQMQNLDFETINKCGVSSAVLMENAGRCVVEFLIQKFSLKNLKKKNISIFSGAGNNGGDGFVVARHLYNMSIPINLFLLSAKEKLTGAALQNFKILENIGVNPYIIQDIESFDEKIKSVIIKSNIFIDAIFGTGLKAYITDFRKNIIEFLNTIDTFKLSVDVPSGIIINSNEIPETFFKPNYTITFGLPKLSFVLEPVCHYIGKLIIKNISFPKNFIDKIDSNIFLLSKKDILNFIPVRPKNSHKGISGRVLIIGGSPGLTGAAALSAKSALKSGAGLVTLGCSKKLNPVFEIKLTECMTLPLNDSKGYLTEKDFDIIKKFSEKIDVIAFGPGLGRNEKTTELLKLILNEIDKPLIIDADGLYHLSELKDFNLLKKYKSQIIITPHYGEFSRLTDFTLGQILKNKFSVLKKFSTDYNTIVLLKPISAT